MFDSNIDLNISLEAESCFIYTTQGFTKSDYEYAATVQKTNGRVQRTFTFIYLLQNNDLYFIVISSSFICQKPPDDEMQKDKNNQPKAEPSTS